MATCPSCGTPLKDEYGMSQCTACGTFSFIDLEGVAVISEPDEPFSEGFVDRDSNVAVNEFEPFEPLAPMPESSAPEFVNPEFQSIEIGNSQAEPEMQPEPPGDLGLGPANDPLGINEFANSEASSAKDGPLLFRVIISGIDTKEIRESIREVIEDSRFAWDSNEIFSKVTKGQLAINGLSPVKASILITRIKHLPISIRWEQYAITQGPPE